MENLDSHIISILESYTDSVKNDSKGNPSFSSSEIWDEILTKLSYFKFRAIEPNTTMSAIMQAASKLPETKAPLIDINEKYKNALVENFYRLEFVALYPSIIYSFAKSGRIEQSSVVRIYCYLWANRRNLKSMLSPGGYQVLKIWINWFFGKMSKLLPEINFLDIVSESRNILLAAISYSDKWFYVDANLLYFDTENLPEFTRKMKIFGHDFEIDDIKVGVFMAKKKYVVGNSETIIRGFLKLK